MPTLMMIYRTSGLPNITNFPDQGSIASFPTLANVFALCAPAIQGSMDRLDRPVLLRLHTILSILLHPTGDRAAPVMDMVPSSREGNRQDLVLIFRHYRV